MAGNIGQVFGSLSGELLQAGIYKDMIRRLKMVFKDVDASAGGTAQTAALFTIPANSILIMVMAKVVTVFDGATTQTLEVGITGNIDKYIDTTDFDPSAAVNTNASSLNGTTNDQKTVEYIAAKSPLIATWTNVTTGTAGKVRVYALYIETDGA